MPPTPVFNNATQNDAMVGKLATANYQCHTNQIVSYPDCTQGELMRLDFENDNPPSQIMPLILHSKAHNCISVFV